MIYQCQKCGLSTMGSVLPQCKCDWQPTPMMQKPAREWVGLTDAERRNIPEWQKIQEELGPVWAPMMLYLYLAIEAKLREKNA